MSGKTLAAYLTRLKITHQEWPIMRDGGRITAVERETAAVSLRPPRRSWRPRSPKRSAKQAAPLL
jgi:hypothetical protein